MNVLFKIEHEGQILNVIGVEEYHYQVEGEGNWVPKSQCKIILSTEEQNINSTLPFSEVSESLVQFVHQVHNREKAIRKAILSKMLGYLDSRNQPKADVCYEDLKNYTAILNSGEITKEIMTQYEERYNLARYEI